jgi:hypothetical protein
MALPCCNLRVEHRLEGMRNSSPQGLYCLFFVKIFLLHIEDVLPNGELQCRSINGTIQEGAISPHARSPVTKLSLQLIIFEAKAL